MGGSEEGGLEELMEFWLRRCWSSGTCYCKFCNRRSYCWTRAQIAACAAGGIRGPKFSRDGWLQTHAAGLQTQLTEGKVGLGTSTPHCSLVTFDP